MTFSPKIVRYNFLFDSFCIYLDSRQDDKRFEPLKVKHMNDLRFSDTFVRGIRVRGLSEG